MSPNSRFLVFRSDFSRTLNLLDLETGVERAILRQHFGALAWRADGAGLLFVNGPPSRRVIHQVALDGKVSLVRDIGSFAEGAWLHFVNDTLVVTAGRKGVHAISLRSGTTSTLYGGPAVNAGELPVSRDGKWIAFANIDTVRPNEELLMMSLDGKQSRVLAQNPYCGIYALGWHPNGRDVFLTKSLRCDRVENNRIYMASLDGNSLRDLAPNEPIDAIGSMAVRADGQQLVYSAIRERGGRVIALDLTFPRR